jgi:hypothetical protein
MLPQGLSWRSIMSQRAAAIGMEEFRQDHPPLDDVTLVVVDFCD